MKKVIIGILIAVVAIIAVYFLLPENVKNIVDYYKMQVFEKDQYAEITKIQNTKVLGQDAVTYAEAVSKTVSHEYWTYEDSVSSSGEALKTITANGDNVNLSLGDSGDAGVYNDVSLQMVFTLDSKGGYNLEAYIDGTLLSKADRDRLLTAMCKQVK